MADTTTDDRSTLGSGDPEYQDEARADAIERAGGEEEYNADPMSYWTAQQGGMPETGTAEALGPQRYLEEQMPDPAAAIAAGFAPQQIPEGLVISDEDAWGHPKGPEPGEQVRLIKNEAVNERMLTDTTAADREHFVLTSSGLENVRAEMEAENPDYVAPGEEGDEDGEYEEDGGLDSMTKAQLIEEAEAQGVEVSASMTKAEIIEQIEAAQ